MSKRLLTAYIMTAMLLPAAFLGQSAAQSPSPRCPADVCPFSGQQQPTGSQMFGVGVNSDAGLTGSVVLDEQNFDITRRCPEDAGISVEVRLISLSASCCERIRQDLVQDGIAAGRLWLSFLDDTQVSRLVDVAQGDARTKIMQTPKMTICDGQDWKVGITDQHFFVTGVDFSKKDGQVVFLPRNEPLSTGLQLCVRPTVSADRHYLCLNLKANQTELVSANLRRFPVTTSIEPVSEGGAIGAPIPFTQFLQQPEFTTISLEKEVTIPDGGTVLLGGWAKVQRVPDNEEPSSLRGIPLIGWLFDRPADPAEEEQILVLVTSRIINAQEEHCQVAGTTAPVAAAETRDNGVQKQELAHKAYRRAEQYRRKGQIDQALRWYKKVRCLCPEGRYAKMAARRLEQLCSAQPGRQVEGCNGPSERMPSSKWHALAPHTMHGGIWEDRVLELLRNYEQACRQGHLREAERLARQALVLDPSCFSQDRQNVLLISAMLDQADLPAYGGEGKTP